MFKILLFTSMVFITTLSYASQPIEKTIIGSNAQSDRVSIYIWTDVNGIKHYSSKPEKNVRYEKKVVITPRVRENYNYSRSGNNSVGTNSVTNSNASNGSTSNLVGVSKPNDYSKNNTNVNVEIPVSAPPSSLPPLPSDFNNN